MTLALFVLIAWIYVIVFFIIEKNLSKIKNIIIYFLLNIIIINLFTIITLNMKLIENTKIPQLCFCIYLQRSVILPLGLLIYANLALSARKLNNYIAVICTFSAFFSIELLLKVLGIKVYIHWNLFATAIVLITLILISNLVARVIRKLPGGCA